MGDGPRRAHEGLASMNDRPVLIIRRCFSCRKRTSIVFSCQSLRGTGDQVYRVAPRYCGFTGPEGLEPGADARLGHCTTDPSALEGCFAREPERFVSGVAQARTSGMD